ncbi:MAG: leucine-rich repeat domain-containing protein [Promethearchaeota archaeon]
MVKMESHTEPKIYCSSCGLPLSDYEISEFNSKVELFERMDQNLIKQGLKLCQDCSADFQILPIFKSVVSAIANQYYSGKRGFKDLKIAVQRARDYVISCPYWQNHKDQWIDESRLLSVAEDLKYSYQIFNRLISSDLLVEEEWPDIFISHSWDGSDKELVEPLVKKLRDLGHKIWFDKEKGLKPGEIGEYLKDAIIDSKFCIAILCKEYFNGKYTVEELEMLYRIKDKKNIIPIWWEDIDKKYLLSCGDIGNLILNTAGITWDSVNQNLELLAKKIDQFIMESQGFAIYNNVELTKPEADSLFQIEKTIRMKIPLLPEEAQKIAAELGDELLSKYDFGFAHHNKHVTALILKKIGASINPAPISIPGNILAKLRYLKHFCAPLINLPSEVGNLKNLVELNLENGLITKLPLSISSLKNLKYFNINNNPIEIIPEKLLQFFKKTLIPPDFYQDITDLSDQLFLYILLINFDKPINQINIKYKLRNGKITELDLSENELLSLPESIENLKILETLELSDNNLSTLPESIGKLTNLKKLDVGYNRLSPFPEIITKMTWLQELYIESNQFTSVPKSIRNLINLKGLSLEKNQLTELPETIGNLKSLKELYLETNHLSSLPKSIGNLTNLQILNLEFNQLTSLPKNIGGLKNLETLDLSENDLSSLPEEIGNLKNLKELYLEKNQLKSLPESIGNLINLQTLELSENRLTSLPESIGNLKNLKELSIYGNKLSSLPESIGNLINLRGLDLFVNELTTLPESIGNLTNLQTLNLMDNKLTSIPESIGNLKNLKELSLNGNKLTSIPESIGNLKNLQTLDLRKNNLIQLPEKTKKILRELKNYGCHFYDFDF